jgi:hypothetical protein
MKRKLIFKKGFNKKKPKRWCLISNDWTIDSDNEKYYEPYYNIFQIEKIEKFFNSNGFKICKKRSAHNYTYIVFFYFRSKAEEARFIMNYANGVEIDI